MMAILVILIVILNSLYYNYSPHRAQRKELMSYMERKYGETFEFVSIMTPLASYRRYGAYHMEVKSKNLPDKIIDVHMNVNIESSYRDNYIMFLMHDEFREMLQEIAKSVYGTPVQVVIPPVKGSGTMPEEVTIGISVEEYARALSLNRNHPSVEIYTAGDTKTHEEDAERLRQRFEEIGFSPRLTISYVSNTENIGNLSHNSNFMSVSSGFLKLRGSLVMDSNYQFESIDWEEATD